MTNKIILFHHKILIQTTTSTDSSVPKRIIFKCPSYANLPIKEKKTFVSLRTHMRLLKRYAHFNNMSVILSICCYIFTEKKKTTPQ